jgi:phosphohistidine swiveling domain-containing protein
MDEFEIKQKILKAKLKHDLRLPLPLAAFSGIVRGYTAGMEEKFGISHKVAGAIGRGSYGQVLINHQSLHKEMEMLLNKNWYRLKAFFDEIRKETESVENSFKKKIDGVDGIDRLVKVTDSYKYFLTVLCFYTSFRRYVDEEEIDGIINPNLLRQVFRDQISLIASLIKYERVLKRIFNTIGKSYAVKGELIRYLTVYEAERFLKNGELGEEIVKKLMQRGESYFYFYFNDQKFEYIPDADNSEMKSFFEQLYLSAGQRVVSGMPVFSGKVRGEVYRYSRFHCFPRLHQVIVAKRASDVDSRVIEKCAGLVLEVGGVLDHTSIIIRERKKPCITMAIGATRAFRNGDIIELNAAEGVARKL